MGRYEFTSIADSNACNSWLSDTEISQLLEKELPRVIMTRGSADIEVVSLPPGLASFLYQILSLASSLCEAYNVDPAETFVSPGNLEAECMKLPSEEARLRDLLKTVDKARNEEVRLSQCEMLLKLLVVESIGTARRTHLFASDSYAKFL